MTAAGPARRRGLWLGIFDHFGWAVAVTAAGDGTVVDRRRLALVEPGVTPAPIHYDGKRLDAAAVTALVATVRASVTRATSTALDELAAAVPGTVTAMCLRLWSPDFPDEIAIQLRAPYEARADAVMYRRVLAEAAHARDWDVHFYDAKAVVGDATNAIGTGAGDVLDGPRRHLGPPWTKDHRVALAATIMGARTRPRE